MPATRVGIVYDPQTKAVLRVIDPDYDAQLTADNFCAVGEALITIPVALYKRYEGDKIHGLVRVMGPILASL